MPSSNFNNLIGAAGVFTGLVRDTNGIAMSSGAAALWESTNTFTTTGMGEENNNFVGADRTLMSAYLDQNTLTPSPTFVQIIDLPDDLAVKYDLYIYTLGGQANRGGAYAVNGGAPKYVVASGDGSRNGPDFVEAMGDDPAFGMSDWGNYVVFRDLSGKTVTITAVNLFGQVPRAPINGLQIVNTQ
jgi:hypothetical protein